MSVFSASRLTPQEQRLEQLRRMKQFITARPFEDINIETLLEDFEHKTGASTVRAKEYFNIESHILQRKGEIQFSQDGKTFVYRADNEEENLKKNIEMYNLNAEHMKQRLEEIEQAKNSQTVKPS
jgi:Spy/CpxP family protein refolding chaperone